jgi:O2-independent ubiquinone biosynthesis accessory factor UbiT
VNQKNFKIPEPVGNALSMLPSYPGSLMFVVALNIALKNRIPQDVQQSLEGKRLRIVVTDAKIGFDFTWKNGGFVADWSNGGADLTIAASAHDFLLLAQRKEDPDTLFFSRRLSMEGDTELGLMVKNTLDAIDVSVFDLAKSAPGKVLAELKSRLKFPF